LVLCDDFPSFLSFSFFLFSYERYKQDMGKEMVTSFANDVFDKADSEDRSGFADKVWVYFILFSGAA
jgi:hypothetical protein